jgi:cell wall-associated NlpC family hydrolase
MGIVLSPDAPERVAGWATAAPVQQARGGNAAASLAGVTDSSEAGAARPLGSALSRWSLIAAALAAALIALGLVLALRGGSHDRGASAALKSQRSTRLSARASPTGGAHGATASGSSAPGSAAGPAAAAGPGGGAGRANEAEVADPEEANSFPAPAGVQHRAAKTPSKASEEIVAAGAPSDAEVKQELAEMQAVERTAKRQQQQRLQPVAGGNSVGGDGTIPIPPNVPEAVQRVIAGANAIADFPYVFGGGHGSFVDNAYDCSGSVSYALAAGGLLSAPETSGELESWGAPGPGRYITIEAAAGHVYMYVDGVMYNTAGRSGVYASRWQVKPVDNSGYVTRHWPGL